MAIDSILMSISGIAGDGVAPKSDSKEGTVRVEPVPPEVAVTLSAIAKEPVSAAVPTDGTDPPLESFTTN